ncbi:hypothetical protein Tco_0702652 [Tanacetum coccineum]|uniref:Uncharacterized protein n=1 Tax=Tanacetum coccineum TaxID=301880 RepID=A0ABQ4XY86_9ASTR
MACDGVSHKRVLDFQVWLAKWPKNPTQYSEAYCFYCSSISLLSETVIDFLLMEEADSFLALEDDPTSSEVDPTYQDPEGDILILEAILNSTTVYLKREVLTVIHNMKKNELDFYSDWLTGWRNLSMIGDKDVVFSGHEAFRPSQSCHSGPTGGHMCLLHSKKNLRFRILLVPPSKRMQ